MQVEQSISWWAQLDLSKLILTHLPSPLTLRLKGLGQTRLIFFLFWPNSFATNKVKLPEQPDLLTHSTLVSHKITIEEKGVISLPSFGNPNFEL